MDDHRSSGLRPLRHLGAVVLALLAAILVAAPAAAELSLRHTSLESSIPAADSVLTEAPGTLTLTFTEPVQNTDTEVTVTGPDGTVYPTSPEVVGSDVRAAVPPLAGSGTFVIGYRVTAADGDAVSGQVAFALQQPAPETTTVAETSQQIETAVPVPTSAPTVIETTVSTTAPSSAGTELPSATATEVEQSPTTAAAAGAAGDSGSTGWVWVVVAVVVAAAVGVVLLMRRRRVAGPAGPH